MPCVHALAVDYNGAVGTSGHQRCGLSNTRGFHRGHRVQTEQRNANEVRPHPKHYHRHSPVDVHHCVHPRMRFAEHECSDVLSLDESIERAGIEADLGDATPEEKSTRNYVNLKEWSPTMNVKSVNQYCSCNRRSRVETALPRRKCTGGRFLLERYDLPANFYARGESHPNMRSKAAECSCGGSSQAHGLTRQIKCRSLKQREMELKLLREERDDAVHELMSLSGKITNCTTVAEEQAKLLAEQSETISKFETKTQMLEKQKQDMLLQHKKEIQDLQDTAQQLHNESKEKTHKLEDENHRLKTESREYAEESHVLLEENKRMKTETRECEKKIRALENTIECLRDDQREGAEKTHALEDENQRKKTESREYEKKIRCLENTIECLRADQQKRDERLRGFENGSKRMQDELKQHVEKLQSLEDVNKQLQNKQKTYIQELGKMEEDTQHLQFELQNHKEMTKNLKEENQQFKTEVIEMEEKMRILDYNNQLFQCEEKELHEKIQRLEDHNHMLCVDYKDYEKLRRYEEERRCLQAEVQDAKQEVPNMEANNLRLKAEHTQELRSIEESNNRIENEHKKQIAALEEGLELAQTKHKEEILVLEERMKEMRVNQKSELTKLKSNNEEMEVNCYKEVTTLKKRIEDMENKYFEERAAFREQLCLHQQRAVIQDEKIKKMLHKMSVAKSELSKARIKEAEWKENLDKQEGAYQHKLKELRTASKEIQELTGVCAELREQAETMDQLWVDNARLVQLLAESDEYQNLLQDMEEGNGLVFCPSHFKASKFQVLAQRYGALSTRGSVNPKTESEHWIPADLYDLVMAFRREHSWEIAIQELHEFLRLVNTFWHEREKKHVVQTKLKYERQISDLRRHQFQRLPYGQVVRSSHSRPVGKANTSSSSKTVSIYCSFALKLLQPTSVGHQRASLEGGDQEEIL